MKGTHKIQVGTIAANLRAWLKLRTTKLGPISATGDNYYSLMQAARAAGTVAEIRSGKPEEGIQGWPSDCLRHTFTSMHHAHWKNAGETAKQLAHSQSLRTFMCHYKNRVKCTDAKCFRKLMPEAAKAVPSASRECPWQESRAEQASRQAQGLA